MPSLRHALITIASALALTITSHAQDHPDFTGTWIIQHVDVQNQARERRDGGGFGGGGGRRGGRRGGGGFPGGGRGGRGGRDDGGRRGGREGSVDLREGDTIRIRQTDERLIVTREARDGDVMTSYSLDGKETKNHPSPDVEVKSKTRWEGVALVTESTRSIDAGAGKMSVKTREILSLSEDQQTLTSTTTEDTLLGKRTVVTTLTHGHER